MMMTVHTHTTSIHGAPPEAVYMRDGFIKDIEGQIQPVFLAHPDSRCEICEFAHGSERAHPPSETHEGLVEGCGGILMRLVR